jgi:hypothetical protein
MTSCSSRGAGGLEEATDRDPLQHVHTAPVFDRVVTWYHQAALRRTRALQMNSMRDELERDAGPGAVRGAGR